MPPPSFQALFAARRPLVWLIVLALVIYGHSATLVQLLGPAHRHALPVPSASARIMERMEAVFSDIRAWRAGLRERLLPEARLHAHAAGVAHTYTHADEPQHDPHPHDASALHAHGTASHVHDHAGYQRHHHDPRDNSVIALDALSGEMADASAQASAGSATLPLALAPSWAVMPGLDAAHAWRAEAPEDWTDASLRRSERPPRA